MIATGQFNLQEQAVLVVAGPTAVGKSEFGLKAARQLRGEIVNADSRQVYKGLDVGTAKPTKSELRTVRHHLVDILDPDEDYSLAIFLSFASKAITDISDRGLLPVVVGGSSQYVFALMEGWNPPRIPPNSKLRSELEKRAESEGYKRLYSDLVEINPEAASDIDPRNVRRVIRALEVIREQPKQSASQSEQESDHHQSRIASQTTMQTKTANVASEQTSHRTLSIGLTLPRQELYNRIDVRVDRMMELGWLTEVEVLLTNGYEPKLSSMSSIGYQELASHITDDLKLSEAVRRIKSRTHRLARSQYVWLRRAHWLEWFDSNEEGLIKAMDRVGDWAARMAP